MRNATRQMIRTLLLATALVAALPAAGATFVYRGALTDRGEPAQGDYGFRLTFYDAQFGGKPLVPSTMLDGVAVNQGAFNATLDLDQALQARDTLWLEVEVRDPTGAFVPLAGREAMHPKAPVAECWETHGNAGTFSDFLGTTDNQELVFRVNGQVSMRYKPSSTGFPNIVGGSFLNSVDTGVQGTVISGGSINAVLDNWCVVGGGTNNTAGDGGLSPSNSAWATVGGGDSNVARQGFSTVSGGARNVADGTASTVPGGLDNCAGGDLSLAAGDKAKVRPAAGSTVCGGGVPTSGDVDGDEGTFVWADFQSIDFVSSGPDQFLVRARGGAGFNTNTPRAPLHVQSGTTSLGATPDPGTVLFAERPGGNSFITIAGDNGLQRGLVFGEPAAMADGGIFYDNGGNNALQFRTNGNVTRMTLASNGDLSITGANATKQAGTTWINPSDRRIKEDIAPISGALDTLLRLRPVSFTYTDAYRAQQGGFADKPYLGFIAQEFAEVFPDAVSDTGQPLPGSDKAQVSGDSVLALDASPALITTIAAAQELAVKADAQAERIDRLERDNTRLHADNVALRTRLDRMEKLVTHHPRSPD